MRAAQKAGRELGWDVVLKATAEQLRERPDLAHVWRNIDTPAEMRDAWENLQELIGEPGQAGFVVQKNAPPGVPVAIRSHRGPAVRAGRLVRHLRPGHRAAGGRSYRIPPIYQHDAASMVREIQLLADAVRLPRQRGRRRRRGGAADPARGPAPERPAPGPLAGAVAGAGRGRRRDRAHRRRQGRTGRPTRARTGSYAGCRRFPGTPSRAEPMGHVPDSTSCLSAPPTTRTAASSCGTRSTAPATTPRWSSTASPRRSRGSRWCPTTSTTSRPSTVTRCAATCRSWCSPRAG